MAERLTLRALNRHTLGRQMLLARHDAGIIETVERLIGLQAQVTDNPYLGLWNRLSGFRHEALTALIVDRRVARATSLRGTLHLHTPDDLLALRPVVQPVLDRVWQGAFRKRFGESDPAAVQAMGAALLDEGPMTLGALGKRLGQRFDGAEPLALATWVQMQEVLVQVPPTRIWGSGHAPLLLRAGTWLGRDAAPPIALPTLVRRYLGGHGPASVADMQAWSGLTRLGEVFAGMGDELVRYEDESGRTLFDLAEAPAVDADAPAPVRFLPDYENAVIGYADRRRILPEAYERPLWATRSYRAVLVDGFVAATWIIRRSRGAVRLEVAPFRTLLKREVRGIEAEAEPFLAFMVADAEPREVVLTGPVTPTPRPLGRA